MIVLLLVFVGIASGQSKSSFAVEVQKTTLTPGQSLGIRSVPNLRDMGGYKNKDSEIFVSGLLYRANQLTPISPGDMHKLANLKLKNVYDLRTEAERTPKPDQLPAGVNNVWLNILADDSGSGPAQLLELLKNPKDANEQLGGGKIEKMMQETYRKFVSLPSANAAFHDLYVSLVDQSKLPALFHCTTGKDRTGWAAAALLTLLGVPEEIVMNDYLRSNDYILPFYKEEIDSFVAAGAERTITEAILGVKSEFLEASFDEMKKTYGNIENYFSKGLGMDTADQQVLRDLYLSPSK